MENSSFVHAAAGRKGAGSWIVDLGSPQGLPVETAICGPQPTKNQDPTILQQCGGVRLALDRHASGRLKTAAIRVVELSTRCGIAGRARGAFTAREQHLT